MINIKIHKSYRTVVAVCDTELLGKYFEEGKRQLDLKERFYKDQEYQEAEAIQLLQNQMIEDATFNIVGPLSTQAAIKAQLISQESLSTVQNIPFALKLI